MIKLFQPNYNTHVLLGVRNEFEKITTLPVENIMNMTINAKRNNFPDLKPTGQPIMNCFGIGLNGYYTVQENEDEPPISQPYVPKPTDADMYIPLPFRVVPIDDDLNAEERAMYRMRTKETYNNKDYWCYWLKKIEFLDKKVKVVKIDSEGKESDYAWDPKNLNPKPDKNYTGDVTGDKGESVVVYLKGTCIVTGKEVIEAINVIYDGDLRKAKISEFGFYTGEDQQVKVPDGKGGTITITESIYTQMAAHRTSTGTDMSSVESTHIEQLIFESITAYLL